jgi:hypothetical protein
MKTKPLGPHEAYFLDTRKYQVEITYAIVLSLATHTFRFRYVERIIQIDEPLNRFALGYLKRLAKFHGVPLEVMERHI